MTRYAIVKILDDDTPSPLVRDFATSYIEHRIRIDKKPTTIRCSEKPTLHFFADFVDGRTVRSVTSDDAGNWNGALRRRISDSSRRTKIAVMRCAWDWAISQHWADDNPFRVLGLPEHRNAGRNLSEEEISVLLSYIKDDRVKRACILSLHTGLRRNEVVSLDHSQIKGGILTITADKSKSGRARSLMLSPEALAAIGPRGVGRVFGLYDHNINNEVTAAWRASEIGRIRFHDFRHTAITRFFEECDDVFAALEIFGWKDPKSAIPYQHHTAKRMRKILGIRYQGLHFSGAVA